MQTNVCLCLIDLNVALYRINKSLHSAHNLVAVDDICTYPLIIRVFTEVSFLHSAEEGILHGSDSISLEFRGPRNSAFYVAYRISSRFSAKNNENTR